MLSNGWSINPVHAVKACHIIYIHSSLCIALHTAYATAIYAIAASGMLNIVKRVAVNGSIIGRGKKSNGIFSPLLLLPLYCHPTLWRIDNCSGGLYMPCAVCKLYFMPCALKNGWFCSSTGCWCDSERLLNVLV